MSFDERRTLPPVPALLAGTPLGLLALLGLGLGLCAALVTLGALPPAALRIAAVAAGHGALLATALAWATPERRPGSPGIRGPVVVALLALGAAGPVLVPWGAVAHLAVPLWLAWQAQRGGLTRLGLGGSERAAVPVVVGLAVGAGLGGHLLLSSARTLGYGVRGDGAAGYLTALAYDVGANVPSGELFFRGALFNRAQRLTAFSPAAALATAASLLRYLVDPLLPKTPEVVLGTLFYMTLLGVANAWLLWWSGSLLPGLLSALVFFAAYRLLAMG